MVEASVEARLKLQDAMERIANGDRAALEDVYRATKVKLFGICLRILGDRKEAEDALIWTKQAALQTAARWPKIY